MTGLVLGLWVLVGREEVPGVEYLMPGAVEMGVVCLKPPWLEGGEGSPSWCFGGVGFGLCFVDVYQTDFQQI